MNEPRRWAFLCSWYENSWFLVHKVKRPDLSFYMASCVPFHLWQRTFRFYQDHPFLRGVLTFFVPPAHNQGVSSAPLQGLSLWEIFLPTTGSFFLLYLLTFRMRSHPGTLRWTFHRGCCTYFPAVLSQLYPPHCSHLDELDTTVKDSVQRFLFLFSSLMQSLPGVCGSLPSSSMGP